ncbi:MAG TPA: DUF1559 domain-containing protein [Tepidisphaeraceae bacterium]|jgi:type II secretory pathway pseudopilin PulG
MKNSVRRRGFTILELLVVIGIIIALAGLLLPVIARARESGKRAQCLSNLRQLTLAWLGYAHDHESHLCSSQLGVSWSWSGPLTRRNDIEKDTFRPSQKLEEGVLWPYLKTAAVYHCPDDQSDGNPQTGNRCSYQINGYLAGSVTTQAAGPARLRLDDIAQAPATFVWIEGAYPLQLLIKCFKTPMYPSMNSFQVFGWPGENHKGAFAAAEGTGISFADGHAMFWKYSDPRTGVLIEGVMSGLYGSIKTLPNMPPFYPQDVMINSTDVSQLEAWAGGLSPPGVSQ